MGVEGIGESGFDFESMRDTYARIPEFQELEAQLPDVLQMVNSHRGEEGLTGQALVDYWDNIGKGMGGFYDSIRENGCSSCGSSTPGCCDGCA